MKTSRGFFAYLKYKYHVYKPQKPAVQATTKRYNEIKRPTGRKKKLIFKKKKYTLTPLHAYVYTVYTDKNVINCMTSCDGRSS